MIATCKPLLALTAADLMIRDVVVIPATTSMRSAAQTLANAQISGAPVVDADGRCVGVLSVADFFRGAVNENLEMMPDDKVGEHMTTDTVATDLSTSIRKLSRMMLDADVHRILVLDDERRPIGIVSSTDVLAAINAAASVE